MNMKQNVKENIQLRSIMYTDAQFLMELNNDDVIAKYVVGTPRKVTLEEQLKWMDNIRNEKNTIRFIVTNEGNPVGTVIVSNIDYHNLTANINIKLHQLSRGKGLGKKCIELTVAYCFEELHMKCLTAHVLSYNIASLTLFEHSGFKKEGVLRSRVVKNGKRENLVIFSILEEEYKKIK